MELNESRWYTFCDEHKKNVTVDGKWADAPVDEIGCPIETCDYMMRGNKRCRKDATYEFYPGMEWD